MQVDAVIVAAGSSTRFGDHDKLAADLYGRPVLAWSIAAYAESAAIASVVVVSAPGRQAWAAGLAAEFAPAKPVTVVAGGSRRRDSVEAGLIISRHRYVAIHDGARPLVTPSIIEATIAAAEGHNGAIAAFPATDTMKEVQDGLIIGHPDRTLLWAAQTPQVVLRQAWLNAARMGDDDETDDAAMLSRLGLECLVVRGSHENLKVTRPLDLEVAALILRARGEAR